MLSPVLVVMALLLSPQAAPVVRGISRQQVDAIAVAARRSASTSRVVTGGARQQASDADTETGADAAWKRGTLEIGGLAGYARGKVYDPQRTPTEFGQVLGRIAVHFGPTFEGVMRGNFAIVVEGVGMAIDQDPAARGGGLNLLIRYSWAAGRWRPSLLAGTGVLLTTEPVPPGETTRNYASQGGVGLQYMVGEHVAIGGEYRFHHLSNNHQTETNPGINNHLVLFGVSWFR